MSSIFIVEDHPRLRGMLAEVLSRTPGFEVCGESGSAEEALEQLPGTRADLVLIDVSLPGMNGLELVVELQTHSPHLITVVLSGHRSPEYAQQARDAGARAYILKNRISDLSTILQDVLGGDSPFVGL